MKHNCLKIKRNSRVRLKMRDHKTHVKLSPDISITLRQHCGIQHRALSLSDYSANRISAIFPLVDQEKENPMGMYLMKHPREPHGAEPSWHRAARCSNLSARVVRRIFL